MRATAAVAFAATAALAATVVRRLGVPTSARAGGRRGRAGSGGGGERSGRCVLAGLHGEFLEDEVVTSLQEGGERSSATKERPNVAEALVEAADHVEDERAVSDDLAKGHEIIGHLFQLAAVVGDGEVALDEVAKPCLEVDGASLTVAKKLRLDGEPGMPSGGALGGDDLAKVVGERGDDPGLDDAVHPGPIRRNWG